MDTLDWSNLSNQIDKKAEKIPYEQNKKLFTKVAFDVFQLNNSPTESLWTLEADENGEQFLVAMYDDAAPSLVSESGWSALPDKKAENITLFYKNTPIRRFASSEYGFTAKDVGVFQSTLVQKLASDSEFRQKFLKLIEAQDPDLRAQILIKFPELAR